MVRAKTSFMTWVFIFLFLAVLIFEGMLIFNVGSLRDRIISRYVVDYNREVDFR